VNFKSFPNSKQIHKFNLNPKGKKKGRNLIIYKNVNCSARYIKTLKKKKKIIKKKKKIINNNNNNF